ncbi:MAG: hypothetical protein Q7T71_06125 [Herbiconiux sp.]|nr:hypothetical protein [Herbiconiux sp.]
MDFSILEGPNGKTLRVDGPWTVDAAAAALDPGVTGVILADWDGPPVDHESLVGLPIDSVSIADRRITELEPLVHLGRPLRSLVLYTGPDTIVDLAWFPDLEVLHADWQTVESWSDRPEGLRDLYVFGFDAPSFEYLGANPMLESLRLDRSLLETLHTGSLLPSLRSLWIPGSKRLATLEGLRDTSSPIEELNMNWSSRIERLDGIEACTHLEQIEFADCASIESLRPLMNLPKLRRIRAHGTTRIQDLDLSPLLALRDVTELHLQHRAGYTPSVEDVETYFGVPT